MNAQPSGLEVFSMGKDTRKKARGIVSLLACCIAILAASHGVAVAGDCGYQIARNGSKYVKVVLRSLTECEAMIIEGFIAPQDCWQEEEAKRTIAIAAIKNRERIRKKCVGVTPPQLGFPTTYCPGVSNIDEIVDCLIDLQNDRVRQLMAANLGLSVCSGFRASSCDDGDACTIDSCNEAAGGCVNTPLCGNGTIDAFCGELCDGTNLNGETCVSRGFPGGGTLLCGVNCTFDTMFCIP